MEKNNWKERLGITYSTNPDFRYQTGTEADETAPPKDRQPLRITLDRRRRNGKTVTLIAGFRGADDELQSLGKMLKIKCGTGGSAKDGEIILQGDVRRKSLEILLGEGYAKSRVI
jgi:translation initiation factor 1